MLPWKLSRVTDRLYRSGQPRRSHLKQIEAAGIRTIINLRGLHPFPGQERWGQSCSQAGFTYIELPALSRGAPQAWMIERLLEAYDRANYPALIHCKAGADRTGFAAALYMHYHEGQDIAAAAADQLALKYGHFNIGKTGVLDFFFETFAAQTEVVEFDQWWRHYDHDALQAEFERSSRSRLRLDRLLLRRA